MINRLALHKGYYCNELILISTVEVFGEYETMVLFEDGEELECIRTSNVDEAIKTHESIVKKWNDKIYEGSTMKLLGVKNRGQFVVKA